MPRPDWRVVAVTYQHGSYAPYTDIYGPFESLSEAVEFKLELELPRQHSEYATVTITTRKISEPSVREIRRNVRDFLQ